MIQHYICKTFEHR